MDIWLEVCVPQLACVNVPAAAAKAAVHLLQPVALTALLAFKFKNSQSDCSGFAVGEQEVKMVAGIFDSCHHQFVPTSGDVTAGSCQRLGMKRVSESWHPVQREHWNTYVCVYVCVTCPA